MTSFKNLFSATSPEDEIDLRLERMVLSFQIAIQNEMDRQSITQNELAKRLNVSAARVSQMLSGHSNNLTMKSIAKIASALSVDFEVTERMPRELAPEEPNTVADDRVDEFPSGLLFQRSFWKDTTANENKFPDNVAA